MEGDGLFAGNRPTSCYSRVPMTQSSQTWFIARPGHIEAGIKAPFPPRGGRPIR